MIPQLRFPEFSDEWHLKILGDIGSTYPGLSGKSGDDFGHGSPYVTYTQIFKSTTVDDNFGYVKINPGEKQNAVEAGDIFFTGSSESPQETGYVSVILKSVDNLYLNSFCFGYRADKNELVPAFARYVLHSPGTRNAIVRLAQGSTRYNISKKSVMNLGISLPSKLEQEKVADFMTAVDERIGSGEQKLVQLRRYKRGVMQKIFSQQIRFKDEHGKDYPGWEEKNIGNVLKERNTQASISDDYPLMAFIAYKGVAPKGDRYNRDFLVTDSKSKKYKQTELGDFIYSSNNLETGSIGLNLYGSASISPVYSIFETQHGYSSKFLGAYLTRKEFVYQMVRFRQGVVYGQWRIHETDFLNIKEKFPCTEEQQKIAAFLTDLDEKIASEQAKLTSARNFKAALLQRMFV